MKKKEWITLVIDIIWKVLTALSTLHWFYILLLSGVLTVLSLLIKTNPFFGIVFGISLTIIAFAIIAIIVHVKERKLEGVRLEKKIVLQKGLDTRQVRHNGEQQMRVYQIFSNASDFNVEITKIEATLKGASNKTVDQFFYNVTDTIHKDKDRLTFPKKIPPTSLNVEIIYIIRGNDKLAHLEHTASLEQAITFSNGATTIIKHPKDKPVYGEVIGSR